MNKERKKERKNRLVTTVVALNLSMALAIPFACQDKQTDMQQIKAEDEISEFFVNEDLAKTVAENFMRKTNPSLKSTKNYKLKKIKDEMGEELIYVINFDEGGFVLMPADNRIEPILAFSENNYFETENVEQMNGVGLWVSDTKDGIKELKKLKVPQSEEMKELWLKHLAHFNLKDEGDPPDDPCIDSTRTVGPYITNYWCQNNDYNSDCPTEAWVENEYSCSADFSDPTLYLSGRAYAGCVAVAMGMIMSYHEYPTSYSWSQMPQDNPNYPDFDIYGNSVVAGLFTDIGDAVDMRYMCTASRADDVDAVSAFKNDFGYSTTATLSDFYYTTTKQELDADRPVYLSGQKSNNAHAWVCDGYQIIYTCLGSTQYLSEKLHMRFGNFGHENDGYYYSNNINGYYSIKMIYGIEP